MVITKDFLEMGMTGGSGISSVQLRLIGAGVPPMKGWKKRVIGKRIRQDDAELFVALRGIRGKEAQKIVTRERKRRLREELASQPFISPVEEVIREHIAHSPLTLGGLNVLDRYLEKLKSGEELTRYEEETVKLIREKYKDRQGVSMLSGWVYLAENGKTPKGEIYAKVGYSKNPKQRMKELKVACPRIKLVAYHKGSIKTERMVHSAFSKYRRAGEWFAFDMSMSELLRLFAEEIKKCDVMDNPVYHRRLELKQKWGIT